MSILSDIPKSFTPSVDRPFPQVGIRDLNTQLYDRNNQTLTDDQVRALTTNPPAPADPNQRINAMTDAANKKVSSEYESQKIYNMSLSQLAQRTTTTIHDILDDLVNFNAADGIRGFLQIFIQSDRLMYVGIIVLAFTLLMILFKSNDSTPSISQSGGARCGCRH